MITDITRALLSLFYIGDIKFAPGTIASLVTLVVWYFIPNIYYIQIIILILSLILSFYLCYDFSKNNDEKDPPYIVLDEFVGMSISLFMVPKLLSYYLVCFILFRFFDILKPSFIYYSQDFEMGVGIVLDDILSGLLTLIIIGGYIYL